jgi:16S rRNA (guanine1207-N2)-methyltransferase
MSDPNNQFVVESATGPKQLELQRYPLNGKQNLQAWEAADTYLLNTVLPLNISGKLLIINDSFGALSCALQDKAPCSISDSWIAQQACRENLKLNHLDATGVELRNSLDWPLQKIDWVLIKIPKSLALLEDQLYRLRPLLHSGSKIFASAMSKHIHTSTVQLFEKIIGPTTTSLAVKKSRLVISQYAEDLIEGSVTVHYPSCYELSDLSLQMQDHAGVFSRGKLDIGTRFFIDHIPSSNDPRTIVDLGCGNGLLGVVAQAKNPNANLIFCDESYMATASAELNWKNNCDSPAAAQFITGDSLKSLSNNSADLILNNPPFHQGNVIGDFIAKDMFKEAHRVLKPGGELWVVANRHLGYHQSLGRLFGRCDTAASNKKFVILNCRKQ